YYPSITKNEIPENDFQAWHYLSRIMKEEPEKSEVKNEISVVFIKQLEKSYPMLPTKMVWGNYLISEIFENRISLSIDYENKNEMISEIVKIAKKYNLVVFEPKSEKIYRP
ncbi:hypothetical protein D7036_20370, partial [Aquimarina sp. BL5]|uniref:hypothetical protein n=1 Tax=Aquimarina sp. BL5 TaxID=1714860 RepID=UPI000EDE2749